jgi:hypothetical protein
MPQENNRWLAWIRRPRTRDHAGVAPLLSVTLNFVSFVSSECSLNPFVVGWIWSLLELGAHDLTLEPQVLQLFEFGRFLVINTHDSALECRQSWRFLFSGTGHGWDDSYTSAGMPAWAYILLISRQALDPCPPPSVKIHGVPGMHSQTVKSAIHLFAIHIARKDLYSSTAFHLSIYRATKICTFKFVILVKLRWCLLN